MSCTSLGKAARDKLALVRKNKFSLEMSVTVKRVSFVVCEKMFPKVK